MFAVRIVAGAESGHTEIHELPTPLPGPTQVLVKVHASGLNRGEIPQLQAYRQGPPAPAGVEFAGEIVAVGQQVKQWRVGDRVMGHGWGSHAEYTLSDPQAIMPIPAGLNWIQAAAFVNVFMTAHDALVSNGEFKAGETVLVNAASSGVGLAAIQIAKQMGAKLVIATTRSPDKLARLGPLGVDVGIDLSSQDQLTTVMDATAGRGVDIVIDCVGGTVFETNLRCMAVKGRLVNIGRMGSSQTTLDLNRVWLNRLKIIGVTFRTRSEAERLACVQACARDVLPLLAAGKIQLPIDRTFPMHEVAQAHAYIQRDQHFGKIVLTVNEELAKS